MPATGSKILWITRKIVETIFVAFVKRVNYRSTYDHLKFVS